MGTDGWKMLILDRKPGTFFSCINLVLASKGRSQLLFTVGLDLSVVSSCELALNTCVIFKESQEHLGCGKNGEDGQIKTEAVT